ncbi:hypothetical protein CERSUDRAFT_110490 [Gelatoporia subvermispora B]|uniref:Heparinase II N-terminal domain-containing protein n=1 Tax=Ceriporiopsis subvermispora (strain B) TaxID=914234 RepID=M2PYH7_CERS8|nr:hypothetical protein CERSUDRAFT_110490 [Gelatoporia subvermispora B]
MAPNYDYSNPSPNTGASPYGSGDPYYNESTGFITPPKPPQRKNNWLKIGVPVLIVVVVAAVVGGVLGSRSHDNKSAAASGTQASATGAAAASQAVSIKQALGVLPTATDSLYLLPVYPSTTNTAAFTTPTFVANDNVALSWPTDTFKPANPQPTNVRPDRPRLIAPAYKWQALPELIPNDPYLKFWNDTNFNNATQFKAQPPVPYVMDGSNGILDPARDIKRRIKAFGYAWRMSNNTMWVDRTYQELQNAVSAGWGPDNDTKWNPSHFLDTAELTAAYAIAYDWFYDVWQPDQKQFIMQSMLTYGMNPGLTALVNNTDWWGWWADDITGNWNCVCNSGLTMGALALLGDDTSGVSEQLLNWTIPNAKANCAFGVSSDGSWVETPGYWYFGTTAHAEMSASLESATGSSYDLLTVNPNFDLTGLFHMYVTGPGSLFCWGDQGPNRFSTTANAMLYYGDKFNHPEYVLWQRDQFDASSDPWSMFYYNPAVTGAFWDGMPLDHLFDNSTTAWAAMRSSWTDEDALYVAVKAGTLTGHQTHNDLDAGDFVIDALGTRWAGETGESNYLAEGYFSSDAQDSERWLYYNQRTEGQNAIIVNGQNQLVTAAPTVEFQSSNTTQGSSTVFDAPSDSTAFFIADLTSAYGNVTSYQRGIRMINGRKQVLVQDDIDSQGTVMWRMHTNATVTVSSDGTSASLQIGQESLTMQILSPTSGAQFTTGPAKRLSTDPPLPAGQTDLDDGPIVVVMINLPAGQYSLQVLFNPQWSGMSSSDFVTPPSVPLSSWTLTSHNSS